MEADAQGEGEEHGHEGEYDEYVETDPDKRYYRYRELVGKGKFKSCHKAFDSQIGIDVAWSKFHADSIHLTDEQMEAVVADIQTNLDLEHPNIIKSFKCWEGNHCINLITELFTSGNLRQFRNHYPHLDMKAVKRMARQILRGLQYLHSMDPPIMHGDLRCDKIYVNGNSGEIKIGDIGLATLMPYRWEGAERQQQPLKGTSSDIFAFGLCMLELLTLEQLDLQHCSDLEAVLAKVQDSDARAFVSKCLEAHTTAEELLDDPFLSMAKKVTMGGEGGDRSTGSIMMSSQHDLSSSMSSLNASSRSLHDVMASAQEQLRKPDEQAEGEQGTAAPLSVGKLRGEDYVFECSGKVKAGMMNFRLVMTQAVQEAEEGADPFKRTIDFTFDPDVDTVDKVAAEISESFNLSPTDTEICAAALREWLAKEMPELAENNKE